MPTRENDANLLEVTSRIVAAHVSNNSVQAADLPDLINGVHEALASLGQEQPPGPAPAVPIADSIRTEYIICLEDGKRLKTLKRHLRAAFGMSPEELPRIFQRFYRCDWSRSEYGNGLGLSLAMAFVRAHGGDITVRSSPGEGSTFTIVLPRSRHSA